MTIRMPAAPAAPATPITACCCGFVTQPVWRESNGVIGKWSLASASLHLDLDIDACANPSITMSWVNRSAIQDLNDSGIAQWSVTGTTIEIVPDPNALGVEPVPGNVYVLLRCDDRIAWSQPLWIAAAA